MTNAETAAQAKSAIAELDKVRDIWLARPGVVGCDVGYSYEDGQRGDEIVIRVHYHHPSAGEPNIAFPTRLGDFRVIVIQANYGFASSE